MKFKVGDLVKLGPRKACGCPSTYRTPLTITRLRPVKPHGRISNCYKCGMQDEIPAGTTIAELNYDETRAPVYRLIMTKPLVDLRVLL